MSILTDDDVVVHRYAERLRDVDYLRHLDVGTRRAAGRIASRKGESVSVAAGVYHRRLCGGAVEAVRPLFPRVTINYKCVSRYEMR